MINKVGREVKEVLPQVEYKTAKFAIGCKKVVEKKVLATKQTNDHTTY
ncbi:hypothetical protein L3V77_03455 [Vibrio sp. DW001]|nr:hypothetical protein [Vibrio sp. DW001]WED27304.1 hypothetical protein L3V77_03455 [Vibrio sp. DW001]